MLTNYPNTSYNLNCDYVKTVKGIRMKMESGKVQLSVGILNVERWF